MKPVRFLIFCCCLLPFISTIYGALTNSLGVNPVETMTRNMGDWALYFLMLTLSALTMRITRRESVEF